VTTSDGITAICISLFTFEQIKLKTSVQDNYPQ